MNKRKAFLLLAVYALCITTTLISCAEQENAPCPKRAESVRNLSRDWDKWSEFYANVRNASPDVKTVNLPN